MVASNITSRRRTEPPDQDNTTSLSKLYDITLGLIKQGFSIIPLQGKRATVSWKVYQQRQPTPQELATWFRHNSRRAYGIICGAISSIVVLDIDDPATVVNVSQHFPHLLDTLIVQSGNRQTPHIYWWVDFPVTTQKVEGGDLKAEGSYVVGPGSTIDGKTWKIINDAPIRPITQSELHEVLQVLQATTTNDPAPINLPLNLTAQGVAKYYHAKVEDTGQRNNSLFTAARFARDAGQSLDWTINALADLHAKEPPHDNHLPENYDQRYQEALATIHSVYNRPARPLNIITSKNASCLPNSIREAILQRPEGDGACILRVWEGLQLLGYLPGQTFTREDLYQQLGDMLSHHTIRRALSAITVDTYLRFFPSNYFARNSMYKGQIQGPAMAQDGGFRGEGKFGRPLEVFTMPDATQVATLLGIDPIGNDPIYLKDIASSKAYRQALERELIKRKPGIYTQTWLANRLNISDRSIRRYHKDLRVQSHPTYTEKRMGWYNLNTLPLAADAQEYDLAGCYLMDETGKQYPAYREVAAKLLKAGRHVAYRVQGPNTYWLGDQEPDTLAAQMRRCNYEKQPAQESKCIDLPPLATACRPTIEQPESAEPIIYVQVVQTPEHTPDPPNPKRSYRHPLSDSYAEKVAGDVYNHVAALSLRNARGLVDTYGVAAVEPALRQTIAIQQKGKLRSPAGFLITRSRILWKQKHGFNVVAPEYKPETKRRKSTSHHDPLLDSPAWLRWRVWFSYEVMHDPDDVERWQSRLEKLGHPRENLHDHWEYGQPVFEEIEF